MLVEELGSVTIAARSRSQSWEAVVGKEFKSFLLRGNVVDLAVGIVIGAAFGAVVTALVADLITPIIAAIIGKPDFSNLSFTINESKFAYGDFINALLAFISIATAVFFFVVKPVNALMARRHTNPEQDAETIPCPECLSEIPREARKCAFCASPVAHGGSA
jgi:large conductance mechanosensitive channel